MPKGLACGTQHSNQAELDELRAQNANSQKKAPEWKSDQVLHESRTSNLPVSFPQVIDIYVPLIITILDRLHLWRQIRYSQRLSNRTLLLSRW